MNDISIYTNAINRLFIQERKNHMLSHQKPLVSYHKPKHIYHTLRFEPIDNTKEKEKIKSASL